jgi:hypothetical protein
MRSDLEDMEHDRQVLKKNEPKSLRFLDPRRPCPSPKLCDFTQGRKCAACQRKQSVAPETAALLTLRDAALGGMPIRREELGHDQWVALGEVMLSARGPRMI